MSKYPQRGRQVDPKNNSLRTFYAVLVIVGLVGIGFILLILTRGNTPPTTATPVSTTAINLEGLPSKGEASAPVTVLEYSDFQCPACAQVALELMPQIDRDYIKTGKIKFYYHDFPLPSHNNAIPASEAAHCAADQNAFWQMHDLLFTKQQEWSASGQLPQFVGYAEQLNLDRATFESCLSGHKYRALAVKLQREATDAQVAFTPTFEINGTRHAANELIPAIEAALAKTK